MVSAAGLAAAGAFSSAGIAAHVTALLLNLLISAFLGKLLAPSRPKSGRDAKGLQTVIKSNIAPRRVMYGEVISGGPYIFTESRGADNEILHLMFALSGHPIDDILGVFISDEYINIAEPENIVSPGTSDINSSYEVIDGKFGTGDAVGHLKIIKVLGWGYADNTYVTDETSFQRSIDDRTRADAIAAEVFTDQWKQPVTNTRDSGTGITDEEGHKLTNCSYIYLQLKFNRDVFASYPSLRFHIKGKRLYNPEQDASLVTEGADSAGTHDINDGETAEWSENWALACLDYLLHPSYGLGAKTTGALIEINWSEIITAIIDSDDQINNGYVSPDTATVPRYTLNGVFEVNSPPISNMESLLTSGAGSLIYSQGQYALRAGKYRAPSSLNDIINEDMIIGPLSIRTHTPRSDLFNKVSGVYVEAGYDKDLELTSLNQPIFEPADFPIINPLDSGGINPYELIDGEEIIREVDYPYCIYSHEAQRLSRIMLERIRQGLSIQFEANLQILKFSVGDNIYLEILSDSKYASEDFFNKLGLDDMVQDRPASPFTPYYKQFKIMEMEYTEQFTISVTLVEESEELYDFIAGDANKIDYILASELIIDDPTGPILAPSFIVSSPDVVVTEVTAGSDINTLIKWEAADRGSTVNVLDRAQTASYQFQYGIVTDPSLATALRVDTWISTNGAVSDNTVLTQGPISLTNIWIDPTTDYDFRVRAVVHGGRRSAWTYYSVDIGSDFTPSVPFGTSRYYILPTNGTALQNSAGTLTLEAREVTSGGDVLLSAGTIQLYVGSTLVEVASPGNFASPSDGYTGTFDSGDITGSVVVLLKDGAGGTVRDSITLLDVTDGVGAVSGYIQVENGIGWTFDPPATWTPSQATTDLDCTFVKDGDDVARISRRVTLNTGNGTLTVSSVTHPDTDLNTGDVTVVLTGDGTTAVTVQFEYLLSPDVGAVAETVTSVQGGTDGLDAIYGYLTKEAEIITADNDGTNYTLPSSPASQFVVTDGITDVTDTTAAVYTIVGASVKNGLTIAISDTIGTKGEITLSGATPTWTTASETFTLRVTYATVVIDKDYTISKAIEGDIGVTGSAGADGHSVDLTAVDYVFTYDSIGGTPAPTTSLVTATGRGFTSPQYRFLIDAVQVQAYSTTATYTYTPDAALSNMPETVSVEAREGAGPEEANDAFTMIGLPGGEAYTVVLTNEGHTLPADNAHVVTSYTGSGTSIRVWKGNTELTSIASAGTPTVGEFDVTAAVDSGTIGIGAITVVLKPAVVADHNTMTTDNATILYTINLENVVTTTKLQSLSKSIEGDPGAQGDAGRDGVVVAGIRINQNDFAGASPTDPGSMYLHGFDAAGAPADVDGAFVYQGVVTTLPKGQISTSQAITSGFIIYDTIEGGSFTTTTPLGASEDMAAVSMRSADVPGTVQWQYDDNTQWVDFTPTNDYIIIGTYEAQSAGTIFQASISAPMTLSSLHISAGRIEVADLSSLTAIIGQLDTRAAGSGTGFNPRLRLQDNTTPIKIYDPLDEGNILFSVSDAGNGNAEIAIIGDFLQDSLNTAKAFSSAGITDLRGRLGLSEPDGSSIQRGGNVSFTTPLIVPAASTDSELTEPSPGEIQSAGTVDDITLNFHFTDIDSGGPEASGTHTASTWDIKWQVNIDSGGWNDISGANYTLTGSLDEWDHPYKPLVYWDHHLSVSRTFLYTGATDSIHEFRINSVRTAGDAYNPRFAAASADEPITNGGVIEIHNHLESEIIDANILSRIADNETITGTRDFQGGITASVVGITGTKAEFDTAVTDGNIAYTGGAHHDTFSDFVANEHIDWTADAGGDNFHSNNFGAGADFVDTAVIRPWLDDFSILHQAITATTTTTISHASGQSIALTLSAQIDTLNLNDWPADGRLGQLQIEVIVGGTARTINWSGGNVTWLTGAAPDLTGINTTYFITLSSRDFGTTVYGSYAADAASTEINDLTIAVVWDDIPIANVPTGTTSSTVSLGNHNHSGVYLPIASQAADSALLLGIGMSATGDAPPGVDKVVRTNTSGYTYVGWLNTVSGTAGTFTRVYCSQDAFLRYLSPVNFVAQIDNVTAWNFTGAQTPRVNNLGMVYYGTTGYIRGKITVSSSTPGSPSKGDIWFDTT